MDDVRVLELSAPSEDLVRPTLDLGRPVLLDARLRRLVQAGKDLLRKLRADGLGEPQDAGQKRALGYP